MFRRNSSTTPRRPINWTRVGKNSSAGIVASIAGYASYWHMTEVALRAGERAELAHVMPLSVDGMLIVASIAMVDDRSQGLRPRRWARIGFLVGITASVAANVTAAQPTTLGRMVAAWPALALLLVVEILSSKGRIAKAAKAAAQAVAPLPATPAAVTPPPAVPAPVTILAPVAQAQQVIAQTSAAMPVPVSPAPVSTERRTSAGTAPVARRASVSPLTGKVLMDAAPKV
jgi:hypothetical protein